MSADETKIEYAPLDENVELLNDMREFFADVERSGRRFAKCLINEGNDGWAARLLDWINASGDIQGPCFSVPMDAEHQRAMMIVGGGKNSAEVEQALVACGMMPPSRAYFSRRVVRVDSEGKQS